MAKISPDRCKGGADRISNVWVILWILHAAAFIALVVFVNWNYCHLRGKGPCRQERDDSGNYYYVRSNLTSAQKTKCEKYESGNCITAHKN